MALASGGAVMGLTRVEVGVQLVSRLPRFSKVMIHIAIDRGGLLTNHYRFTSRAYCLVRY